MVIEQKNKGIESEKLHTMYFVRTFLVLIIGILLLTLIPSVSAWEFDNVKGSIGDKQDLQLGDKQIKYNELWEKYNPIEIKNSFGLGKTLFKGAITGHTEKCGGDCQSTFEVEHSGGVLIQDIRFKGNQPRNYGIYIQDGTKPVLVNDYKQICETKSRLVGNGTNQTEESYEDCDRIKIGSHYETKPNWRELNIGEELNEGNYNIKISGSKGLYEQTDWQIKTQGDWIEEWALWDSSVVAYYKLDETSGDVVDATENGNNGTNNGATRGVTGKINNAFDFDGTNDYVNLSDGSLPNAENSDFTLSAWIKSDDIGSRGNIIGRNGRYGGCIGVGGAYTDDGRQQIRATAQDGNSLVANYPDVSNGVWYHVVGVFSDTDGKVYLYVDGDLKDSVNWDGSLNSPSDFSSDFIGVRTSNGADAFDGTIDEVGTWDRALTSSEVEELYYSGSWIELNNPSGGISNVYVTFNASANSTKISDGTTLVNMSLWTNETGSWEQRNITTGLSGTYHTQTWDRTLDDGYYKWNVQACVSDGTCNFSRTNYTFSLDATAPTIDIESPTGTLDYSANGNNETLNVTVTDTNLDSCWYNYNGTNTTFSCSSGVKVSEEFELEDYGVTHNLTVYAIDSVGNINSTFNEWSYKVFEHNRSYNSTVYETDYQPFKLNISSDLLTSTAKLIYDGVEYSTTKTTSGDNLIFTKSLDIPTVSSETDRDFYWKINYDGETINTYNSTQTVKNWYMNWSESDKRIDVTIYDEETGNIINSTTLGTLFEYYVGSGTNSLTWSDSYEQDGEYNIGVTDANVGDVFADAQLTYSATGYQQRNYYNEFLLTNTSVQDIDLYLLLGDAGVVNLYTTTSSLANIVTGVSIKAYKLEGDTETLVDATVTDDNGEGNIFLDPDYQHRIVFEKDGCDTLEKNIYPTGGSSTVQLDCGAGEGEWDVNESVYEGLEWDFKPQFTELTNGTKTFQVEVSDEKCYLSNIVFSLKDDEGTVLNTTSSSESCGNTLNLTRYVHNGTIISTVTITKNETDIVKRKEYTIINTADLQRMDKSLWDIITELDEQEFLGLSQKSKMFLAFIIIFLTAGTLSMMQGVKSDGWGSLIFVWLMIFMFSFIGWLNIGVLESTNQFSGFINKYALSVLGGFMLVGILLQRSER